ncbi:hypothetical protein BCR42DRAFT_241215 [Absidia repens]|uniref:Uncharacterized protein n=1 Tax=Absidia repens TaxID=90262 RepID=A0A1X2ILG8_9FUNG|nr:hypothetical protein BCR42DRAFT_241215 [Absidia repens]
MAPPHANYFIPTNHQQQQQQHPMYLASGTADTTPMDDIVYSAHRHQQPADHLPPTHAVVPSMGNLDYYAYRNNSHMSNISSSSSSNNSSNNNSSLQDLASHSVDQLDQHSLLDYASKASSSMFSLPVSDSSPATPSQQSLFYNDSMDQLQQHQQYYQQQPSSSYYQLSSQPQKSRENPPMLDLPIAPTLPSNTSLDSSFYYTHPCVSTASFHEPVSSSSPFLTQQQHDHQATLEFYGSYTPSSTQQQQQQQHQYSAQPW